MLKNCRIFFALLLSACAHNPEPSEALKTRFITVEAMANESNIVALAPTIYTRELIGKNFDLSPEDRWTAMLWKSLPTRHSYHESISGNEGCLSVNGYSEKNSPAAIYVQYVKKDSLWLINLIELNYLESENDFTTQAKCPVDIEAGY